jgi:uncharacterized membrane protein YedE/YeeE
MQATNYNVTTCILVIKPNSLCTFNCVACMITHFQLSLFALLLLFFFVAYVETILVGSWYTRE